MQETYLYCKLQDWRKWQKLDKKKTGKRNVNALKDKNNPLKTHLNLPVISNDI